MFLFSDYTGVSVFYQIALCSVNHNQLNPGGSCSLLPLIHKAAVHFNDTLSAIHITLFMVHKDRTFTLGQTPAQLRLLQYRSIAAVTLLTFNIILRQTERSGNIRIFIPCFVLSKVFEAEI